MLFTYETPTPVAYWMKDTLIPLDIWFFDEEGTLIGTAEMGLCPDGACPAYASPAPVKSVLETPQDSWDFEVGDVLTTSVLG
jgi:uncharacterized protein